MESISDAFEKSGMNLNSVREAVLKQQAKRIQDEIVESVTYNAVREPIWGIFERMQDLYMGKTTRNFTIHIIKSFLGTKLVLPVDQHNFRPNLKCPICDARISILEDVVKEALNFGVQYINEHKDKGINDKEMKAFIRKSVSGNKTAVCSPMSDRFICSPCYYSLARWMKWSYTHDLSDGMLRKLHYELYSKESPKIEV